MENLVVLHIFIVMGNNRDNTCDAKGLLKSAIRDDNPVLFKETILNSVKKTHRLVIVTEECLACGTGVEIAAIVCEEAFDYLDAPIKRGGSLNFPTPLSPVAAAYVRPDKNKIINAIKKVVG